MEWKNEKELQNDLAQYFRDCGYLTYTEIEVRGTGGRPDVAVIPMSYNRFKQELRCYEVKVSRTCFLDDVKKEKYKKYLQVFPKVYYAIPKGLVKVNEVPKDIGLIVRNENGWYVEKAPRINKDTPNLTIETMLSFLFHGYEQDREIRRLTDKIKIEENLSIQTQAKYIGDEISKLVDRYQENKYKTYIKYFTESLYKYFKIDLYQKHSELYLPNIREIEYLLKVLSKYKDDSEVQQCLEWVNDTSRRECFSFDGSSRKLKARMKQIDKEQKIK